MGQQQHYYVNIPGVTDHPALQNAGGDDDQRLAQMHSGNMPDTTALKQRMNDSFAKAQPSAYIPAGQNDSTEAAGKRYTAQNDTLDYARGDLSNPRAMAMAVKAETDKRQQRQNFSASLGRTLPDATAVRRRSKGGK